MHETTINKKTHTKLKKTFIRLTLKLYLTSSKLFDLDALKLTEIRLFDGIKTLAPCSLRI